MVVSVYCILYIVHIRWLTDEKEYQKTDVHKRSVGEGLFNYRFKFPFEYDVMENMILKAESKEKRHLPELNIEILDENRLHHDIFIGK